MIAIFGSEMTNSLLWSESTPWRDIIYSIFFILALAAGIGSLLGLFLPRRDGNG